MADATSSPRTLPELDNRPRRSECLLAFDQSIKLLNDYFHGTRAAWEVLQKKLGEGGEVSSAISADLEARLHVSSTELNDRITALDALHRYVSLVHAVAAYEDFLRQLVQSVLERRPLPKDGRARIEVPFAALEGQTDEAGLVHRLWAAQEAGRVVGAGYAERPKEVRRVLGVDDRELKADRAPKYDLMRVKVACLMRNSIVHDGSRVDERLKGALDELGEAAVVGAPVPLTDAGLLVLFGHLYKHAEALDLLVRWEPEDRA